MVDLIFGNSLYKNLIGRSVAPLRMAAMISVSFNYPLMSDSFKGNLFLKKIREKKVDFTISQELFPILPL